MSDSPLFFDRFELQPVERRLLRDGKVVVLRPRAFDLLLALAAQGGGLVTKGELLDRVWSGLVVEENNIAAQVTALRKVLGNDLIATVPGRGYRLTAAVRQGRGPEAQAPAAALDQAPLAAAPAAPAGPELFGRELDRQRLEAALQPGACITLVGPGGVGKTALARVVAAGRPAAQTAWVDLAVLGDGAQLTGALCRALRIASLGSADEQRTALAGALDGGGFLLVLDNAEHLVDAVAALAGLLRQAAPSLALLVTSQVPLRISGEQVQPLDPLAPPADTLSDDEALAAAPVRLLMERVRAADPRFMFDLAALPMLRRLCARLDGLPLALEMAAPMVPLLGLPGVLSALDDRLQALRRGRRDAASRHRTLRAAMQWSHDLLEPPARRALRRLAVFANGFSLELAVAVAGDEGDDRWSVIDTLAELVDRSLVASLQEDPPRYRLLETTRAYALEQLDAAGEREAVQARALRTLVTTLAPAQAAPAGQADAVAARELGNVPTALAWARAQDPASAVQLTLAASAVATWTPWLGEAAGWVEACEPLIGPGIDAATQATWWRELARFQSFVRGPRAVEAARKACEIERERGDAAGLFWSLIPLMRSRLLDEQDFAAACREAQALLDAHPDWPPRGRVVFSGTLALEYRRRGDFESAWQHQQDEAELAQRAGLHHVAANAQSNLVATLVGLGRFTQALQRLDAMAVPGEVEVPSAIGAHNRVQRLNALIGLDRLDEAQAFAAEALAWCRRFEVLDVFQVLALLAARRGRLRPAAMLLSHHRARLASHGAGLPADSHAPWREAQRLIAQGLRADESDPNGLPPAMQASHELAPEEIDRLLQEDSAHAACGKTARSAST